MTDKLNFTQNLRGKSKPKCTGCG